MLVKGAPGVLGSGKMVWQSVQVDEYIPGIIKCYTSCLHICMRIRDKFHDGVDCNDLVMYTIVLRVAQMNRLLHICIEAETNGRHFADDIFKCIFLNENVWIPIKVSLKFVPKGPINNIPALVQIMAWRRPGDKPLSEPMVVSLPTHICVARPQWLIMVNCPHECRHDQVWVICNVDPAGT